MHIDWKLLARYLSQECSEKEKSEIEKRMQSDPDFKRLIYKLKLSANLQEKPSKSIDIDFLWHQLENNIALQSAKNMGNSRKIIQFLSKSKKPTMISRMLKVAAVFLIIFVFSYLLSDGFKVRWENRVQDDYRLVKIDKGERFNITLADGSLLTVDAGSEIRYFTTFSHERHVYLKGEACFNVVTDPDHPFYVHAGHARVRVIGTRFNVRTWDSSPHVVITVAEGKVNICREDSLSSESIELSKGEQSKVPLKGPIKKSVNIDAERYFKWMQNEIHFENSTVRQVISQLQRWYAYQFIFQNPKALDQKISVHIKGANVNEVISVISAVTNTEVVRKGNTIQFLQKKK